MQKEHEFLCPHCTATISMLLDLTEEAAQYIEDCEVCCRPIRVSFSATNGKLEEFHAEGDI